MALCSLNARFFDINTAALSRFDTNLVALSSIIAYGCAGLPLLVLVLLLVVLLVVLLMVLVLVLVLSLISLLLW